MSDLKKLRDATGVSIIACKKALDEAGGDFEKAVDLLRKKGAAKAADRAGRSTGEGAISTATSTGKVALIKLGCETDFVAKGDDFVALAQSVADRVLAGEINEANKDEIADVKDAVLKLGENIQIAELALLEGDSTGTYVHSNGKIGVVVALKGGSEELAKDVAMHAAATNPQVLSPNEVADELVAKEKEIWSEQLKNEGKPAEIIEKIMMGKEKKFREESALLKQPFVKNPEQSIEELVAAAGAEVLGFKRFAV